MLKPVVLLWLLLLNTSVVLAGEASPLLPFSNNGYRLTVASDNTAADESPAATTEKAADSRDCTALGYKITLFSPCPGEDGRRLWRQTKILGVATFGVAAAIALMPESVSKWNKDEYQSGDIFKNWRENVKEGPVWDTDVWYLNYIAHPYFGGAYYQMARKSGYNQWNSFVYSALMSTFFWEYGIEAFAETPSLQDLVVTPLGGWVYGEWAYHKEKAIRANGNKAMGSRFLGSIALFILDPVGKIDDWCCVSKNVEVTALNIAYWPARPNSNSLNGARDYWGLKFSVQFR